VPGTQLTCPFGWWDSGLGRDFGAPPGSPGLVRLAPGPPTEFSPFLCGKSGSRSEPVTGVGSPFLHLAPPVVSGGLAARGSAQSPLPGAECVYRREGAALAGDWGRPAAAHERLCPGGAAAATEHQAEEGT
jgi:hypothetical protein